MFRLCFCKYRKSSIKPLGAYLISDLKKGRGGGGLLEGGGLNRERGGGVK